MMRARRGMTLMELVIGLAITGMMAAAGAGAFASIIDKVNEMTIPQLKGPGWPYGGNGSIDGPF